MGKIYKNGCWGCLRAIEDPAEKYVCPKMEQHWSEHEQQRETKALSKAKSKLNHGK